MKNESTIFSDSIVGFGQIAETRREAVYALTAAMRSVSILNTRLKDHPLRKIWERGEWQIALANAMIDAGQNIDSATVFKMRLGVGVPTKGSVSLQSIEDRSERWRMLATRGYPVELRRLLHAVSPPKGRSDILRLADGIAHGLNLCSAIAVNFIRDPDTDRMEAVLSSSEVDFVDAGDLALAVPFAWRRMKTTSFILPAVSGKVRVFGNTHYSEAERVILWAKSVEEQASQAEIRLTTIERYMRTVKSRTADLRRPETVERIVEIALSNWGIWAAKIARETGENISTAWRALRATAGLGLIEIVPGTSRSRGDGTIYAATPWLQYAGLIGLKAILPDIRESAELSSKLSANLEADRAMRELDEILRRSGTPIQEEE